MTGFALHNNTVLRGYLAHLQALARHRAALRFEHDQHPGATAPMPFSVDSLIRETWECLSRDLVTVLGPVAQLKPYGQLAQPGSFSVEERLTGQDPFRITMKALKLRADKARRHHPDVTLLKSWDLATHEPPKQED